jgi:hypothetical protein
MPPLEVPASMEVSANIAVVDFFYALDTYPVFSLLLTKTLLFYFIAVFLLTLKV